MTDSKEVDFIFYSFVIDLINDKFYTKYNIKLSLAENEKDFNFNFSNLTKIDIKNYYNNLKLFLKRDCLQELYNEFIKENPTKNDNLTKENFLEENFKKKIIFEEKLRSDLSKSTGIKLNSQQEVFSNYLEQRNNFHLIEIIDIDGKEKYYAFEESIIPDTYPNIYEINQDIVNNTQDDNLKEKIKSCKKIENIDGLAPIFSLIEKTFINEVEKVHYREELLKMEKIDSLKKIMKNLPDTENIDHENAFLFDERYAAYLKNDGSIGIFDIFDNLFIPTTAISLEDNIYILKNIGRNLIQKNNVLLCSNIMSFDIAKKYFEEIETEIKKLEEINKSESCLLKNDNFSFSCSIDDINRIQCSITNDNKISFLIMKGKWGNEYLSDYPLSDFSTEENIQMLINFGKKIEEIDTDEMKRGEKIKIEEYKKKVIQEIRKKTLEMREKQGEIKVIDIKKVNVVNDNYQYHILECQKENERETSYLISETNFLTGNTTFSIIDKECYEYFYTIESDNINIFLTNIKNFDKKLYAANSKEVEKITKAISTFCDTQKTTNIEEDYFIKELREILTINEKYDYSFNTIDNPISLQIYKTISSQPNKTEYERDIMLSYNNLYERNLSLELFINGKGIFIDIEEFENNKNKGIHFYNDNINEEEYLSAINERLKNFINYLMEKHYQSSSNNNIKEANFLNELLATQYEYLDRLKNFQENIQQRIKVINEKESQPPLNPIESIIPITISEIPNKLGNYEFIAKIER
jgi:hypothetical protein